MPDVPGSLERFAHIVAEQNANVILFNHDRVAADLDIDEAIIEVVCEVSGDEHAKRLLTALKKGGYEIFSKKQGGYELFSHKN